MRKLLFKSAILAASATVSATAQQVVVGIAPTFDAGSDDAGPAIAQHLALYLYRDLLKGTTYSPVLLNPGGVYSSFDTSWLYDYARENKDLDLLLVTTLKPTPKDGTLIVDVALLDAHTGSKLQSWTTTSATDSKKNWLLAKGSSFMAQSGVALTASEGFERSPLAAPTNRIADSIRDALPTKATGITHVATVVPPTPPSAPCVTHTHITYSYKHAASKSQLLLVNDLDQTNTLKDGISTFTLPEGPMLVQFSLNDSPYTMTKQPIYQLSTYHSCAKPTLIIDLGPGGDAHHHWE